MGTEASLRVCQDIDSGLQILKEDKPQLIIIDCPSQSVYDEIERKIQEKVGLFSEEIDPNRILFLLDLDFEKASFLVQSPLFGGFIMRKGENPEAEGKFLGKAIRSSRGMDGIQLEHFFALGKDQTGSRVQTISFQHSHQKQEAVEAVRRFLVGAKFQTRMASVVANAVDELVMNAMFDAPTDELGKPLYVALPRSTRLELQGRAAVEMMIGFDGEYVGVRVRDHFGSLDKNRLLTKLAAVYTDAEYQVRSNVAGAGLGLSTVMRSGASLIFNCESKSRTDVTFLYRRFESYKDFREQFRFVSTQFFF